MYRHPFIGADRDMKLIASYIHTGKTCRSLLQNDLCKTSGRGADVKYSLPVYFHRVFFKKCFKLACSTTDIKLRIYHFHTCIGIDLDRGFGFFPVHRYRTGLDRFMRTVTAFEVALFHKIFIQSHYASFLYRISPFCFRILSKKRSLTDFATNLAFFSAKTFYNSNRNISHKKEASMPGKIKVGDNVVVASLGEMKVYEAKPRTLEAEAGLKEFEVKLDLVTAKDYIDAHKKLQDIVTDEAGRFKGGIAEEHNLELEIKKRVIEDLAKDINAVAQDAKGRLFVSIPEPIEKEVEALLDATAKSKIKKLIKKDYLKTSKEELVDIFNEA